MRYKPDQKLNVGDFVSLKNNGRSVNKITEFRDNNREIQLDNKWWVPVFYILLVVPADQVEPVEVTYQTKLDYFVSHTLESKNV